jgi:hypothetical protein
LLTTGQLRRQRITAVAQACCSSSSSARRCKAFPAS